MRALTPWRYAAWYHTATATASILIMPSLVAAIVLLALPASRRPPQGVPRRGSLRRPPNPRKSMV